MNKNLTKLESIDYSSIRMPSSLSFLTDHIIRNSLVIDQQSHDFPDKYIHENYESYCTLISLWGSVIIDNLGDLSIPLEIWFQRFANSLQYRGLLHTIDEAVQLSEVLITQQDISNIPDEYSNNLFAYLISTVFSVSKRTRIQKRAAALQVLRFPKRFSPSATDTLESEAWKSFCDVDRQIGLRDTYLRDTVMVTPTTFTASSSFYLSVIADLYDTVNGLMIPHSLDPWPVEDGYFSDGAIPDTLDGVHYMDSPYRKICAAISKDPRIETYYGIHNIGISSLSYTSKWLTVPKAYNKRRQIAEEEASRNFWMQGIRRNIERQASQYTNLNLRDQEPNQFYACMGSKWRTFATIDCSAASDHISRQLIKDVFRDWETLVMHTSPATYYKGGVKKLNKYSTSGSGLCFPVESCLFYAIAYVFTRYAALFLGLSETETVSLTDSIIVYGDDILVPTIVAETVIDGLQYLGFEINMAKTHYRKDDPYRESCGKEYWNGEDISSQYFPRATMEFAPGDKLGYNPETILALVGLQHKFAESHMIMSDMICQRIIRRYYPTMTESPIGSSYSDIWSEKPLITLKSDSRKAIDYQRQTEVHTSLVTTYTIPPDVDKREAAELLYKVVLKDGSKIVDQASDPIGHLLGILEPNPSLPTFCGKPALRLKELEY